MKPLLLTFDVEEFDLPGEFGRPLPRDTEYSVTESGLSAVLELLSRQRLRATFFVTAAFAIERPAAVLEISRAAHEIAAHGFAHGDNYTSLDPKVAVDRLAKARSIIEGLSGQPVRGVRTPRLLPCRANVLREAGFSYDASPHPTWVPRRYCGLGLPRSPWCEAGLVRLPISVLPVLRGG